MAVWERKGEDKAIWRRIVGKKKEIVQRAMERGRR